MGQVLDLTGEQFGRWKVLSFSGLNGGKAFWLCQCECGTVKNVRSTNLTCGVSRSCGCLRKEQAKRVLEEYHKSQAGQFPPKNMHLYYVWREMRARCNNPTHPKYKDYGARGIRVCDAWNENFYSFQEWALKCGYSHGEERAKLSLDRINNDLGYSPDNCRFTTAFEQTNNRRVTRTLEVNGVVHTLGEWSSLTGLSWSTLRHRIEAGLSLEDVIQVKND